MSQVQEKFDPQQHKFGMAYRDTHFNDAYVYPIGDPYNCQAYFQYDNGKDCKVYPFCASYLYRAPEHDLIPADTTAAHLSALEVAKEALERSNKLLIAWEKQHGMDIHTTLALVGNRTAIAQIAALEGGK